MRHPLTAPTLVLLLALTAPAAAQDAPPPVAASAGTHTLNFKDADIRVFISTVSEITGKSFIIDPRVEGKVNVVSQQPIDAAEVYQVFESVLRVYGYAAIPSGRMVKIVPEMVARQDGQASAPAPPGPDTLTTRVIDLRHVSATELMPILTQLVPQSGQVSVHQSSNSLVITDRAGNIARIEAIIRRIDQASDAAVEVIPLSHANAAEVARTLTLLAAEGAAAQANGAAQGRVIADARTNSLLLSGDRAARLRLRTLVGHLDTPLETGESTQVIYLRYAKAQDLVAVLEGTASTLTRTGAAAAEQPKAAMIQAHAETNALVITADPAVYRALAAVVRQLDVRRAQVLIEGVIAELSDESAREIGVQFQGTNLRVDADGNVVDEAVIGGTNFSGPGGTGSILGASANPGAVGPGLNLGYVTGSITLPGSDRPILQIGALVRALAGDGRNNILSTPSVVTLDNTEAELSVGQEVPFIQGEFTTSVGGQNNGGNAALGNPFRTIERKEVGLKLKVTPHINEGDSVRLDLSQEVSSLAPTPAGASDLITNKRTLSTSVLVPDGHLLVLGGLISNEVRENVSKVPGLGDIPVLGNLFRYRSANVLKRNLMVFLKPTILKDALTEQQLSADKYNFIRAEQLRARARIDNLSRDDDHGILPPLDAPAPDAPRQRP